MGISMYATYREYYRSMCKYFEVGDKKTALEYEKKIKEYIELIDCERVVDDIHYELHLSKFTQLSWPYRKKKGMNAEELKIKKAKENGTYEEEEY